MNKNIKELESDILDNFRQLPLENQHVVLWLVKNIKLIKDIIGGEAMSAKELNYHVHEFNKRKDYLMVALLELKKINDEEKNR